MSPALADRFFATGAPWEVEEQSLHVQQNDLGRRYKTTQRDEDICLTNNVEKLYIHTKKNQIKPLSYATHNSVHNMD